MMLSPFASMPTGQKQIPTNADLMAYLERPDNWALAEELSRDSIKKSGRTKRPSPENLGPVITTQEQYDLIGNRLHPRVASLLNLQPERQQVLLKVPVSKEYCVKAGLLFAGGGVLMGAAGMAIIQSFKPATWENASLLLLLLPTMAGVTAGWYSYTKNSLPEKASGQRKPFGGDCVIASETEHLFELIAVHELAHVAQTQKWGSLNGFGFNALLEAVTGVLGSASLAMLTKHFLYSGFLEGQAIATERLYAKTFGTGETTHQWHADHYAASFAISFYHYLAKRGHHNLPAFVLKNKTSFLNFPPEIPWEYSLGSLAFAVAEQKQGPDVARLALEEPFEVFGG